MAEIKLEELVEERWFAGDLELQAEVFFRLANSLLEESAGARPWKKRHYFQLINEADSLETFLDDFGARYNQTYSSFTELVASLRWFAYSGFSISHLLGRIESYGVCLWGEASSLEAARGDILEGLNFVQVTAAALLRELIHEACGLGLAIPQEGFSEKGLLPLVAKKKLPRNVGQARLIPEEQKIAEVASKYLEACALIGESGVRFLGDAKERHSFVELKCKESSARLYQATVHNLQSSYDTQLQNTILEHDDARLPQLRGHASSALHLLQAVTYLSHFIERHERETHFKDSRQRIADLIARSEVEHVTVNIFLLWAHRILQNGVKLAEDLLPVYSNLQELEIKLAPGLKLHARPAALIVGIVNHWGTPVELELASQRCNAGSILALLVAVGSHPDQVDFLFRGDERPLRDIRLLFESGLGELGLASLPPELSYLCEFN